MCNDMSFIQQLHSTVQVEQLNETAINSNKLAQDTFFFLHYYKNDRQFKKMIRILCVQIVNHC